MPRDHVEDRRRHRNAASTIWCAPLQQKRQRVEPGAVRHRRGKQMRVALVEPVDIGVVALAHEEQVAVGQHRALRPAGRARGVEQPGPVGRRRRIRGSTGSLRRASASYSAVRVEITASSVSTEPASGASASASPGVATSSRAPELLGDVLDLARMQPGVGRHRAEPGRPAAEQQFEELAAIFQAQQDPVAGREAARPQPAGDPRRCARASSR